ncbi:hypothetical protein TWF281_008913 [Arthrobotrys megalospora]
MKPTAAGTLLPTIFYTLTLLSSSSAYVVPTLNPGPIPTFGPNPVLAQAQQRTGYTISTTLTISNADGGVPTLVTLYNCPKDLNAAVATYTITTTPRSGAVYSTLYTVAPCIEEMEEKKSRLSQGAIVGIAIGVSIPILAGVFFVFWRMWKKDQQSTVMEAEAFRTTRTQGLHPRRNKSISTVSGDAEALTVPGTAKSRSGVVTEITAGK